ncbi:hypothetical protein Pelo_4870 [Pelomyxa schiedti]|nr:hypothetical protein Pelo_4870 [Pelomyxa schiedti]
MMNDAPLVVEMNGTTAVSQFVALLSSSHPRCGVCSPARIICSVGPIMCSMWRDFVVATAHHLVVVLGPYLYPPTAYSVPMIVSPLLDSVLNSSSVTCSSTKGDLKWLAPHFAMETKLGPTNGAVVTAGVIDDRPTIYLQAGFHSPSSFANSRWLIVPDDSGHALVIRRLPEESSMRNWNSCDCVLVEPALEVLIPESDVGGTIGFFDNLLDPDEVLMCSTFQRKTVLTLIDVGSTVQSKKLVVVGSGQLSWEYIFHTCGSACVMRRRSGGVVFVVSTIEKRDRFEIAESRAVKAVDSTTGSVKQLSPRGIAVIHVNSSVFCICPKEMASYEVWDCNNLDQPLRIVETVCAIASTTNQVVGGRCFMFVVLDGKVVVMDTMSGFIITSFLSVTPFSFNSHISKCNSLLY